MVTVCSSMPGYYAIGGFVRFQIADFSMISEWLAPQNLRSLSKSALYNLQSARSRSRLATPRRNHGETRLACHCDAWGRCHDDIRAVVADRRLGDARAERIRRRGQH